MSMIGKTLGTFECTALIGKGGMGEVYKAKDQKLGRDVAIKVLPEEFAKDADRVARFQREAKLLASLNHPNIASIYGLEESEGTHFLVLELIEGDTLADRLKRGAIPVEESLKLALQIAEALEAAHEKGVIHRDLKPANIKVTPDGKVKVLDFGLAKAFAGDQGDINLSNSPTLSVAATQQGMILGTAAYMSPEQAKGKAVDKRTDIWAFGAVLYEMLTGQTAFQGEDVTEILASVVKASVNLDTLPQNIRSRVQELISRCLQKALKDRYRDIGDVQLEIKQILADPKGLFCVPGNIPENATRRGKLQPWILLGVAVIVFAVASVMFLKTEKIDLKVSRLVIPLSEKQRLETDTARPLFSLSPDGSKLVYAGTVEGKRQLFLRDIDKNEAKPILGTDGASGPFFSPDGRSICFFAGFYLKRVDLSGGDPVILAVVPPVTRGASWGDDDTIVLTQDPNSNLDRYTSSGEPLGSITELKQGLGLSHRWPEFLPGGRAILYTRDTGERLGEARIEVLSLDSGKSKVVIDGATCARYARSGHIVFARSGNLLAVPFDIDDLEVNGDPAVVIENVLLEPEGAAQFDISDNGTLVYIRGGLQESSRDLVWIDRTGKVEALPFAPLAYETASLSPDGRRLAIEITSGANQDIYMCPLAAGNMIRMTTHPNEDFGPLWTPDGQRIIFASEMSGTAPQLHWMPYDRSKDAEIMLKQDNNLWADVPGSFTEDGNRLALTSVNLVSMEDLDSWTDCDIRIASLNDSNWSITPLANSRFKEHSPAFSPDDRWIAYVSDETGIEQIYVQPFPGPGEISSVSISGGTDPTFNPNGRELFYRNGDRLMVRPIDASGEAFSFAGPPEVLFEVPSWFNGPYDWFGRNYAVNDNGQRFLIIRSKNDSSVAGFNIVLNWFEELKEKVPAP